MRVLAVFVSMVILSACTPGHLGNSSYVMEGTPAPTPQNTPTPSSSGPPAFCKGKNGGAPDQDFANIGMVKATFDVPFDTPPLTIDPNGLPVLASITATSYQATRFTKTGTVRDTFTGSFVPQTKFFSIWFDPLNRFFGSGVDSDSEHFRMDRITNGVSTTRFSDFNPSGLQSMIGAGPFSYDANSKTGTSFWVSSAGVVHSIDDNGVPTFGPAIPSTSAFTVIQAVSPTAATGSIIIVGIVVNGANVTGRVVSYDTSAGVNQSGKWLAPSIDYYNASAVSTDADGRVVIAFTRSGGAGIQYFLVRMKPDLSAVDGGFGVSGYVSLSGKPTAIAVDSDSRVLVAEVGTGGAVRLERFTENGGADSTFAAAVINGEAAPNVVITPDGASIYLATMISSPNELILRRYCP